MKKIDLGQTVSIIANLGVIAGIVFLAIEINQNNKLLQAEAIGAVLETRILRNQDVANNESLAELITKNRLGDTLSDTEFTRLRSLHTRTILGWERDILLFREGILREEQLAANIPIMRQAFRAEAPSYGIRDYWYEAGEGLATRGFRAFVERCVLTDCEEFK